MKKSSKILFSILPLSSVVALSVGCQNNTPKPSTPVSIKPVAPIPVNPVTPPAAVVEDDLATKLNKELDKYSVVLKDENNLKKLPKEIKLQDLEPKSSQVNQDFVFQFAGGIKPDQSEGKITFKFYLRGLDPKTNQWIKSPEKEASISGFKNDNDLTNEALEKATLDFEEFDFKTSLPSEAIKRNFISIINYDSNLYTSSVELAPDDEAGDINVSYKLINKANNYATEPKTTVLKGFKTLLEFDKENTLQKLNSDIDSIARLTISETIDKDLHKASSINIADLNFPEFSDTTFSVLNTSFNDDKGTYSVEFKLNSNKYSDLSSRTKTITISGFLTNGQIINKSDSKFRKELQSQINASPLAFIYKDNADRHQVMPSTTVQEDFSTANQSEGISLHIKSLNKNDTNGTVSIVYTVSKINPETNNDVEINDELIYEVSGFYTQRQFEIDTEQTRLNNSIASVKVNFVDNVNKGEILPSNINKGNFKIENLPDDTILEFKFIPNDEKGLLKVIYSLSSLKQGLTTVNSIPVQIEFKSFLTAERNRINIFANEFQISPNDIKLDDSIFDKDSFNKYYGKNKEKMLTIYTRNIENTKITLKDIKVEEDLKSITNPFFNLVITLDLSSTLDPDIVIPNKTVKVDYLDVIGPRFLNNYLAKVSKVKLTDAYEYLKNKMTADIALSNIKPNQLETYLPVRYIFVTLNENRKNDTIEILSSDNEKGILNVEAIAHLGTISARKKYSISGFLAPDVYNEKLKDVANEIERLNTIVDSFTLKQTNDFLKIIEAESYSKINKDSFGRLYSSQDNVDILIDDFSKNEENSSITITYRIKTSKVGFVNDPISPKVKKETYKVFNDLALIPIYNDAKANLLIELNNIDNAFNKKAKEYIPSEYYDKFESSSKFKLFNGVEDLFNKWNLQILSIFYKNLQVESEQLKPIYDFLSNILKEVMIEITAMYKLGWPSMKTSDYGFTFDTLRGYALGPILYKIWKMFKNEAQTFVIPINDFIDKSSIKWINDNDKNNELKNDIKMALFETLNDMYDFQINVVDWTYAIDGNAKSKESQSIFMNEFPNYRAGRTYLTTTGWDRIFDQKRDENNLNQKINKITTKYNLNASEATQIHDFMFNAAQPLFSLLQIYRNGIKKGFSSELLSTVLNAFKDNIGK
ncbi:lipoprotein 17-related variable surface protein [Mycoplasma sp. Z244C]